MTTRQRMRTATVGGLLLGVAGIALLWISGVQFPFVVPPGIIILGLGAAFVAFAPWRWAPGVGAALGLFVIAGFLLSPAGLDNITGQHGAVVAVGQAIQQIGVLWATVAGVLAVRAERARTRRPA